MREEVWKDLQGWEEFYQISNLGKVRSKDREWIARKGFITHLRKGKIMKSKIDRYGYCAITLQVNGVKKYFTVHRLVAITFIENPENKKEVNHINGVKTDNCVENLEWVTYFENQKKKAERLSSNTGGLAGAIKDGSAWRSAITLGGKKYYLGKFDTAEAANFSYCAAYENYYSFNITPLK